MKSFLVIKSYTAILFGYVSRRFRHLFIVEKDLENSSFLRTMKESVTHVLPSLIITFFVSSNI